MNEEVIPKNEGKLLYLQAVLERLSNVPQATITKIEGFARGGGHEMHILNIKITKCNQINILQKLTPLFQEFLFSQVLLIYIFWLLLL